MNISNIPVKRYEVVQVEDGYEIHDKLTKGPASSHTFALYSSASEECEEMNKVALRNAELRLCKSVDEVLAWHSEYNRLIEAAHRIYDLGYTDALLKGPRIKDLQRGIG